MGRLAAMERGRLSRMGKRWTPVVKSQQVERQAVGPRDSAIKPNLSTDSRSLTIN